MTKTLNPPVVTHRRVLTIALPMTLAYLTTPLLGVVDTVIVGQLGINAAIGGVGVGALIFSVINTSFNFLRMSTTSQTAQALGRGDIGHTWLVFYQSLMISSLLGLFLIGIYAPLTSAGLWFIGAENEVNDFAWEYISIRILSSPLALINFALSGWFMGLGRSWIAFVQQTFLNLANIAFSIFFVIYLDMGVAGAAWGTVVGELLGVLFGFGCIILIGKPIRLPWKLIIARNAIKKLVALNSSLMVRSFALVASFGLFTHTSAGFGTNILAANEILLQFFYVAGYFLDGCAVAAEQMCGQALGAKSRETFRRAARLTALWNIVMAALLSATLFAIIPIFISYVTPDITLQNIALEYYIWAALTPLFGVLAFQMDGIYFGAGWSRDLRNQMLVSLISFVVMIVFFTYILELGNNGLWLAFNAFLLMRGVTLLALYPRSEARAFA